MFPPIVKWIFFICSILSVIGGLSHLIDGIRLCCLSNTLSSRNPWLGRVGEALACFFFGGGLLLVSISS